MRSTFMDDNDENCSKTDFGKKFDNSDNDELSVVGEKILEMPAATVPHRHGVHKREQSRDKGSFDFGGLALDMKHHYQQQHEKNHNYNQNNRHHRPAHHHHPLKHPLTKQPLSPPPSTSISPRSSTPPASPTTSIQWRKRRYTSFLSRTLATIFAVILIRYLFITIPNLIQYQSGYTPDYQPPLLVISPEDEPEQSLPQLLRHHLPKNIPQVLQKDRIYHPRNGALVIPEYKLLFFTIPKVACSEWKRMFMRMTNNPRWCETQGLNAHDPKVHKIKYLAEYPLEIATAMMTSPAWTRAVFVREPMERVLSSFLDKAVKEDYFVRKCCYNFLNNNGEKMSNDEDNYNDIDQNKKSDDESGVVKHGSNGKEEDDNMKAQIFEQCMMCRGDKQNSKKQGKRKIASLNLSCVNSDNSRFFNNFLHFVTKYPDKCHDVHWEGQYPKIDAKWWPYVNFVGRQDRLTVDAERLLRMLTSASESWNDDEGTMEGRKNAWERYGVSGWGGGGGEDEEEGLSGNVEKQSERCENRTKSFLEENTSTHKLDTASQAEKWYTAETKSVVKEYWKQDWGIRDVKF